MKSAVILISGRGSNMEAIVRAGLSLDIRAVIANRPDAAGLGFAREAGIATQVVDHKAFASREEFDLALGDAIAAHTPDYVILAGFMRILTPAFIARFQNRIFNIHPSLLPAFPGLDTHQRAIDAGVRLHGATVHVVTPALDHGPILAQVAVPVMAGDTADTLAARVLAEEHRMYPHALKRLIEGSLQLVGEHVVETRQQAVLDNTTQPIRAALHVPSL